MGVCGVCRGLGFVGIYGNCRVCAVYGVHVGFVWLIGLRIGFSGLGLIGCRVEGFQVFQF